MEKTFADAVRAELTDVVVSGYDATGNPVVFASGDLTKPDQTWLLQSAIDVIRSES